MNVSYAKIISGSSTLGGRKAWLLVMLLGVVLLSACGQSAQKPTTRPILSNSIDAPGSGEKPLAFTQHQVLPTATPQPTATPRPKIQGVAPPTNIPSTGIGPAPYGPPPAMTAEEMDLTQKLFAVINSDRAAQGRYPYTWNATLEGGARLHSWNMFHCGFSHTCPDGKSQYLRIANEGFMGHTYGENIGYAGPYPTPWGGVHNIQESMVNEPPTAWHHIYLFSTTLHQVGVGIYVDPSGFIWFTEDFVS